MPPDPAVMAGGVTRLDFTSVQKHQQSCNDSLTFDGESAKVFLCPIEYLV